MARPTQETAEDRVTLLLREKLVRGDFAPGTKLVEAELAEEFGVSRIPVRRAIAVLQRDGLLIASPRRGSVVASFTIKDIAEARELRGVLEGTAARLLAERGIGPDLRQTLSDIIEETDSLFESRNFDASAAASYGQLNTRFHDLIVAATDNRALRMAYDANCRWPLASPASVAVEIANLDRMKEALQLAQVDHRRILASLDAGSGSRAEALMREHAQSAIDAFLDQAERLHQLDPTLVPGLRLVVG